MTQGPQPEPQPQNQPWWQTLPGMLTAIAGTLTAITGLVVALNQAGILKPSTQTQSSPSTPSPSVEASATPSPVLTPSPSAEASVTPNPASNSVEQPIETLPNGKPKKEKK